MADFDLLSYWISFFLKADASLANTAERSA